MKTECIDCPLYNSSLGICMVTGEFIKNPRIPRECALTNREIETNTNNLSSENFYEKYTYVLPKILDQILSDTDKWIVVFTPREKEIELALQLNRSKYIVSIEGYRGLRQSDLDSILKYFSIKGIVKSYKYRAVGNLVELKVVYSDVLKTGSGYKSMLTKFILDPRNIMLFSSITLSINRQIFITKYSINDGENIFIFKMG